MAKQGALSALGKGGMSELWARLRFLFLAIIVYRIGAHIPVPGINPDRLADLFRQNEGTILSLFNMFSGGALERMSIFALGIMPYISASIIMQLMSAVSRLALSLSARESAPPKVRVRLSKQLAASSRNKWLSKVLSQRSAKAVCLNFGLVCVFCSWRLSSTE